MSALRLRSLIAALAFAGCGGINPIDVHDERVPLEARQWVGGADDTVAIARAALDDARAELAEVERWRKKVSGLAPAGLEGPLKGFVAARIRVAELRVDKAEAALDLAHAARLLVHAETAMRYDLAVYDLAPLRADLAEARAQNEVMSRRVEEATLAREKAGAAFWSAYRAAYPQNTDVGRLFWVSK